MAGTRRRVYGVFPDPGAPTCCSGPATRTEKAVVIWASAANSLGPANERTIVCSLRLLLPSAHRRCKQSPRAWEWLGPILSMKLAVAHSVLRRRRDRAAMPNERRSALVAARGQQEAAAVSARPPGAGTASLTDPPRP